MVFGIKEDLADYNLKQQSFRDNKRDPQTHSITVMPSYQINKNFFLNLEYGFLGTNYARVLKHSGLSLNYTSEHFDLSLGWSESRRDLDTYEKEEILTHLETKVQFVF